MKPATLSNFRAVLIDTMRAEPDYWKSDHGGDAAAVAYKLIFSYSDLVCHHLGHPRVAAPPTGRLSTSSAAACWTR